MMGARYDESQESILAFTFSTWLWLRSLDRAHVIRAWVIHCDSYSIHGRSLLLFPMIHRPQPLMPSSQSSSSPSLDAVKNDLAERAPRNKVAITMDDPGSDSDESGTETDESEEVGKGKVETRKEGGRVFGIGKDAGGMVEREEEEVCREACLGLEADRVLKLVQPPKSAYTRHAG